MRERFKSVGLNGIEDIISNINIDINNIDLRINTIKNVIKNPLCDDNSKCDYCMYDYCPGYLWHEYDEKEIDYYMDFKKWCLKKMLERLYKLQSNNLLYLLED